MGPNVSDSGSAATGSSGLAIGGGAVALALGAWGEWRIEAHDETWLGVALFLASIAAFVWSARALAPAPADLPSDTPAVSEPSTHRDLRAWATLAVGAALACIFNVAALQQLWGQWDSQPGLLLWVASLVVIAVTAIVLRAQQGWPARWGIGVWPASWAGRVLLAVTVLAILALATAGRLLWLDKIPLGINPDEGDRASTAIRILRGEINEGIFDYGWFSINILYFWVLGQVMKVAGLTFVGARVLGALSGIATVATVTWIGIRHFGYRVGVMAGGVLAVLGIALQFGRETTEATPTAFLWTLSAAALLEASRRGRSFSWMLAGLAGGLSIYFYPTGRMWPALAALYAIYLFANGLGRHRARLVHGVVLAAVTAALTISPFMLRAKATNWDSFTMRARYTSIFVPENRPHLLYFRPEWSLARLLRAQMEHSIGIFNRYPDMNGFWPTERPLTWGVLAVLTLIGLGWICLRVTDPRCVLLAVWFWIGFAGVIVTVETPNVQRMGTAIPVLGFLPALILDNLARRLESAFAKARLPRAAMQAPISLAFVAVAALMVEQWHFYFYTYGPMDEWSSPTLMGHVIAEQGSDTDVFSLGRQWHISNQGWVRLLAAETPRGGLPSPGVQLPVPLPADNNLAFMIQPEQPYYLPYVRALYPGGITTPAVDRGQTLFTMYRVSREQRAATQGALAVPPQGAAVRVATLGEAPPGWTKYPTEMRWTAAWRIPQFWNYEVQIGPGPARLSIDGKLILTVPDGAEVQSATLSLAQGEHFVEYDGVLKSADHPARFAWAIVPSTPAGQPATPVTWQSVPSARLRPVAHGPDGLFTVVTSDRRMEQRRVDGTLGFGSLTGEMGIAHYNVNWTGTLNAPTTGDYKMSMFAQGVLDLTLDGRRILHVDRGRDQPVEATVHLDAGPHAVSVDYQVVEGPGGIEWTWVPPGGEHSIVPRWVLAPPPGAGVGPAIAAEVFGPQDRMPAEQPIEIAK